MLEIGYHDSGDASGFRVLLRFPDDAHAYDGVAPLLARAGYRALAVYLRGYGPTRFLDRASPRTAEQAAIGQDVIDFADALTLPRFAVAGFDWGGRAACVAAALRPDRVRAAVLIGGYSIQNTVTPPRPAPPEAARRLWYQWYFNAPAGRDALEQDRRALCELLWREWSPTWRFSQEMFNLTAASFDNPDFVDCVIHSYRHRNFNAPGEPRFVDVEQQLRSGRRFRSGYRPARRRRRVRAGGGWPPSARCRRLSASASSKAPATSCRTRNLTRWRRRCSKRRGNEVGSPRCPSCQVLRPRPC
jgi:pimeloyl-ACP methyl ester carboxylesterase